MFRIVLSLSALLLAASIASAQPTSTPFICQTNAGVPPIVRAESRTETVGDYVVVCSGGTQGQPVAASFTMFLNTNVTSRVLSDNGTSEALLLVDEPGNAQQVPGTNVFAAKKGPQGENSLLFADVPFSQPGSGGSRVFRFTNIRVDASLVGIQQSGSFTYSCIPLDQCISVSGHQQSAADRGVRFVGDAVIRASP